MDIHIVGGGQFGSEGKGAFTADLVERLRKSNRLTLVRVAGPNAGHTAIDRNNMKWALRQIPVAAIVDPEAQIVIAQGSEIIPAVLKEEINALEQAGYSIRSRLTVDANATIISDEHAATEAGLDTLKETGSTFKGIGAARAARIMRTANRVRDGNWLPGIVVADTARALTKSNRTVVIEGTQGYGLGLHTEYYPHVTSSNVRCGDLLAMTGIQPWQATNFYPWLVFRTYPIRIAGASGPLRNETSWEAIGQEPERTTVTKKVRRIGSWDQALFDDAIRDNGGWKHVKVALRFIDYNHPELMGLTDLRTARGRAARNIFEMYEHNLRSPIHYFGTGPKTGIFRPAGGWHV